MSRGSDFLFGLDLGTNKITVAVAERVAGSPGDAQIIAVGQASSRGIRRGQIVNLEQAVGAVSDAIADAESMLSNVKISRAVIAISAAGVLQCRLLHGMISLGRSARTIMPEDLDRVIETALSNLQLPPGSCVMHSIPISYAVDGSSGIDNPLEMTGTRLEVDLTALYIPTSLAQNMVNLVEKAGVKVSGLILKPLAESLGTLSVDERAMGASLVSVGAGTTCVSVYSGGHLLYAQEIAIGGDHISNDISLVLKIPFAKAEELKKDISVDPDGRIAGKVSVEVRGRKLDVDKEKLREIITDRLDELFADLVVPALKEEKNVGLSTDVVLSGGVMLSPGIVSFTEGYLDTRVRIGVPVRQRQMPREHNDCRYGAAAGIIVYLLEKERNPFTYVSAPLTIFKSAISAGRPSSRIKPQKRPSQSVIKTVTRNIGDLFKELF